jgi:hypothetical protein
MMKFGCQAISRNQAISHTVVFVDPSVPDLQHLINGIVPAVRLFVLDPNRNGIHQIAAILSANNFHDLAAISIVSHGAAGELRLGSTALNGGNLESHCRGAG